MRLFYDAIERQGMKPAAALRSAQWTMSQQRQWADPYYWAGFVIEGDWTAAPYITVKSPAATRYHQEKPTTQAVKP